MSVDILRLGVGKDGLVRIRLPSHLGFQLLQRGNEIQVLPERSVFVELSDGGRGTKNLVQDRMHADVALVALGLEQFLQVVHRIVRFNVLLVQLHGAHPDRRF